MEGWRGERKVNVREREREREGGGRELEKINSKRGKESSYGKRVGKVESIKASKKGTKRKRRLDIEG